MKRALFLVALIVTVLSACGQKTASRKLSLSEADKVNDTLESIARAERAGVAAHIALSGTTPVSANSDDQDLQIVRSILASPCQVFAKGLPKSGAALGKDVDYQLEVSGVKCPITVQYALNLKTGILGYDLTQSSLVKVTDKSLLPYSDIDSINWKSGMNGKWDLQQTRGWNAKVITTGSLSGSGEIHSQKYGTITVTLDGKLNGERNESSNTAHAEQVLTLKFPDLLVDFKVVADVDGAKSSQRYLVNDEEVSEAQYRGYLDRAGTIFVARFPSLASPTH